MVDSPALLGDWARLASEQPRRACGHDAGVLPLSTMGQDNSMNQKFEQRFWAKVEKTETCWNWTAATCCGYGAIRRGGALGGMVRAHRVSWEMVNGPIPAGAFVCHHCDNPLCVRPSHLFIGDAATNARDMASKGRSSPQRHPEKYRGPRMARRGLRPTKQCKSCSRSYKPMRSGLCSRCYDKRRRPPSGLPRTRDGFGRFEPNAAPSAAVGLG